MAERPDYTKRVDEVFADPQVQSSLDVGYYQRDIIESVMLKSA